MSSRNCVWKQTGSTLTNRIEIGVSYHNGELILICNGKTKRMILEPTLYRGPIEKSQMELSETPPLAKSVVARELEAHEGQYVATTTCPF